MGFKGRFSPSRRDFSPEKGRGRLSGKKGALPSFGGEEPERVVLRRREGGGVRRRGGGLGRKKKKMSNRIREQGETLRIVEKKKGRRNPVLSGIV